MDWQDPWRPVGAEAPELVAKLQRELGPRHPLAGARAVPVARRHDQDDVLFELPDREPRYALVHLTWAGRQEMDSRWPHTEFFHGWEEWVRRGMSIDDSA
jgi:hypothetical protein